MFRRGLNLITRLSIRRPYNLLYKRFKQTSSTTKQPIDTPPPITPILRDEAFGLKHIKTSHKYIFTFCSGIGLSAYTYVYAKEHYLVNSVIECYPNGGIRRSYSTKNGVIVSPMITYYSNGKIYEITTYQNSVKSGGYTSYYPSGLIKEVGEYKQNMKHDRWILYNEQGVKVVNSMFENGTYVGDYKD